MSNDPFAPSTSDTFTAVEEDTLSSFHKGVAITAIIFGTLGLIGVCFGSASLVAVMGNIDALAQTQPMGARDAYRELLQSTRQLLPLTGAVLLLTVACCFVQIFGGIQALRKVGTRMLAVAALAAAITDLLVMVSNLFTTAWQWPAQQAFVEAAQSASGPAAAGAVGGVAGGLVGIASTIVIYTGLSGFWLFAFLRLRKRD